MYYPELDAENIWRAEVTDKSLWTSLAPDMKVATNFIDSKDKNVTDRLLDSENIDSSTFGTSPVNDSKDLKVLYGEKEKQCDIKISSEKFDCYPENDVSEKGCEIRGCCWYQDMARRKPLKSKIENDTQAPVDIPYCFYPRNFPSYLVDERNDTPVGFSIKLKGEPPTYYPKGVKQLAVYVSFESNQRLHVKVFTYIVLTFLIT
jgi:hypothetical protein